MSQPIGENAPAGARSGRASEPSIPGPNDPLYGAPDETLDRSERTIAISRLVLSIAAFAILFVDPRQPVFSTGALYVVLGAYIAYSSALIWLFANRGLHARTTSKPILVADIAWYTVLVALSEGTTSPFFLFYLFAVCTAAIRWGMHTTMRVAISSAALYLLAVVVVRRFVMGPDFGLHSAHLLRPLYLVLLGYLVGQIGEHELSAKRRLIEMIAMQREVGRSRSQLYTLVRMARRFTRFFGADDFALQLRPAGGPEIDWEGSRTKGGTMVIRTCGQAAWSTEASSSSSYRVSHALGNWGRRVETSDAFEAQPQPLEHEEPGFLARSRTRSLISVPIRSAGGDRGRLLLGRAHANFSREDLRFCQSLVSQAAVIVDNVALQAQAEELAVAEERGRIARDVHDGFVQTLATIDVGLEVCRKIAAKDPSSTSDELAELQLTVKQGCRDARRYMDRLRNDEPEGPDVEKAVRELVIETRDREGLDIGLAINAEGIPARHGIGFEVLQIVREGLTNVIRHADASSIRVSVDASKDSFLVAIRDNGRGFPGTGRQSESLPRDRAPWSIRERVASLGGDLRLSSGAASGSLIEVTLPRKLAA